ncbi:BMC domain-containing protein [Vibrio sp. DW001]|uniref:BMC domain-containing protein n=1 Tax=Vibrio sp. DW001 TaxID=2912315 RepID=UPI0023B1175F|nr:BMC domain-containing protein [Vibrio sp. DW001]
MKISLGLLEVKGLALAINTADAMAKCAAINIIDIEKTNGDGWMVIKITGDVAAVQAAISSGASLANKNGGLVSEKVLPRPDLKLLDTFIPSPKKEHMVSKAIAPTELPQVVKDQRPDPVEPVVEEISEQVEVIQEVKEDSEKSSVQESESSSTQIEFEPIEEDSVEIEQKSPQIATCNLCLDPQCPRHKGEPHGNCVNGGKYNG